MKILSIVPELNSSRYGYRTEPKKKFLLWLIFFLEDDYFTNFKGYFTFLKSSILAFRDPTANSAFKSNGI
ncbi:hypothetical protein CHRY9390_00650 [Chryseobacterium aquaeductus]|uniref:Uncharacterized protein n=1 Tax=Chryseobacterium aquaeductus TaxID=2675056 RepID=A0A9N8MDU3_9FLAO|nr:hypothetical protein CHRY9390_00650 [Chryseobacterium potabilaquae]CAD7800579.1 hypothetical protein CHRY9390_00650 [Chryseobacterium aquaeductus]